MHSQIQTRFELSHLEQDLHDKLSPGNISQTIQAEGTAGLKAAIAAEGRRISTALRELTCSNIAEELLGRIIRTHQRETIKMLDNVYCYINPAEAAAAENRHIKEDPRNTEIYQALKAALRHILSYIEKDLHKYLDREHQQLPESERQASAREMMADRNILWAKLKAKQVDEQLVHLVLEHIAVQCSRATLTYQAQDYTRHLQRHLLQALKSNRRKDWDKKIAAELISLNFNKRSFFTWCRRYMAREIDSYTDSTAQTSGFSWYLKALKQIPVIPKTGYKSGRPGIRKLLNSYIGVELMYLSGRHKDNPEAAVKDLKERAEKFDYKLPLNLTVDQLGLFVELFIRLDIFPVEKGKMKMTMEFFAENVSTVGRSSISAVSLNNKRRPDSRTIAWMRDKVKGIEGLLEVMEGE